MERQEHGRQEMVQPAFSVTQIVRSTFYRFQFLTVTVLVALATLHSVYGDAYGKDLIWRATDVFDFRLENSIPTAFSALNLLVSSVLLFAIYQHCRGSRDPLRIYWMSLSLIFFGLSADEVVGFHERLHKLQDFTGILIPIIKTHSWILYGFVFTIVIFVLFVPFLKKIDRRLAALFVLSGGIFVTGALGLEFVAAWMLHNNIAARADLSYVIRRVFEEGFEMYGIAVFNCTLFDYVVRNNTSLTLIGRP